ncbi:MAG: MBL fold metallo-hydrolase [Rhizobiaceae bacterium]
MAQAFGRNLDGVIKIARTSVLAVAIGSLVASGVSAQTYDELLDAGAATTEQNFLNVPFAKPKDWKTPYGSPNYWPTNYPRGPIDRSPKDKTSKVITLGTGDPPPNPYRFGPAHAVIINDFPYFIDAGEGWFRSVGKAVLSQGALDLATTFGLNNIKYLFLTHLHEDHTVGLPSFISGPFKFGPGPDKKIYGPPGIDEMISHINSAWRLDRNEMFQGSTTQKADGATAIGVPVWPMTDTKGRKVYEDDNVTVEAFPTKHGFLQHTYAYRFTAKSDGRVMVFGGDGHYSEGLVNAAKDADILVIEGITRKNIMFVVWGGDTEEEKVKIIGAYHMFPKDMKKVQDDSGVKQIVLTHVQNYNDPEHFDRLSVLKEMQDAGVKNILLAEDGDLY